LELKMKIIVNGNGLKKYKDYLTANQYIFTITERATDLYLITIEF